MRIIKNIFNLIEDWCWSAKQVYIKDLTNHFVNCTIGDVNGKLKFTGIGVSEHHIKTPTGYAPIKTVYKTVPYTVYEVQTESGKTLKCADKHKLMFRGKEFYSLECNDFGKMVDTISGEEVISSYNRLSYSEEMYDIEIDDENHVYYTNGILSHNTTTAALYILWMANFMPHKTCAILANKEETAKEIIRRVKLAYMNIPRWLQAGLKTFNEKTIELENGSVVFCSGTSMAAISGKSVGLLFVDEVDLIPRKLWEGFYSSVYPTVAASTKAKIILSSTPKNGIAGHWYRIWTDAKLGKSNYKPFSIKWDDVPGRDEAYKQKTIKELGKEGNGEKLWDQEFNCSFLTSSDTLVPSEVLNTIGATSPISSNHNSKAFKEPEPGKRYIISCDIGTGKGMDYSVAQVIDVTQVPYEVVYTYRDNQTNTVNFAQELNELGYKYNNAYILIENNVRGVGEVLTEEYDYENLFWSYPNGRAGQYLTFGRTDNRGSDYGVRMSGPIKLTGGNNMVMMLSNGTLILNDADTVEELSSFVKKAKGTYAAMQGTSDDLVMPILMACWAFTQESFKEYALVNASRLFTKFDPNREPLKPKTGLGLRPNMIRYSYDPNEKPKSRQEISDGCIWTVTPWR